MMGTVESGTPNAPADNGLRKLSDEASRLAATVTGPLRCIRLRNGESSVELEWEFNRGWAADFGSDGWAPQGGAGPTGSRDTHRSTHGSADRAHGSANEPPAEPAGGEVVRSPMVGTFYCAPGPGEPPFVAVGSTVEPDTVIGIVEAMKLMNQITAERHGVVREVLVSDKQPVEYDQPLVLVAAPPSERDG